MTNEFPQALTIAGSDSGGGAGMQADLKTIQMRHVFATTVVVAVTDTGQSTAADNAASASARRVPIFGRLPTMATDAETGR